MILAIATTMAASIGVSADVAPDAISVTTPQGRIVKVQALSNNVLKVTNTAPTETVEASKVTVMQPGGFTGTTTENSRYRTLATPTGVVATLDKISGELKMTAGSHNAVEDNSLRPTDTQGRRTMRLKASGKSFHGAGERGHSFNLHGDTLTMYNRQNYGYTDGDPRISQMNISMPLLVSPDGYAIVFDDYAEGELVASDTLTYSTISPSPVSYYFVSSQQGFTGLPRELTALTGRQPLPPMWSLGYITSKYGYKTQAETDSVVNMLKSKGYPLDGIVLDLYWYGKEEDMGRLDWNPAQWPDHRQMLAGLKEKGVNLVAISQPYVLRGGHGINNYNELAPKGMLGKDSVGGVKNVKIWVGEGGMLDVSNPDTRAWLRNRYRTLTDEGITGWWGDLGEPEVHPDGMHHANGLTTRQYHNLYGNDWSSIIHNLFREEYPGRRLMTLMRGGTTGLQRYSVFPWSTDVSRSWGGLAPQVTIMTQAGLSGLGYMGHDVGGFAVDTRNPEDAELYVRWLQLGLFSPMLRTHATFKAEPYHYPQYEAIIKRLIADRYRWLPYNYTLAYENATKGYPLVRPLNFTEARSNAYDSISDEFLWGGDVLVAPVMTQGATRRNVTFPQGSWVDFNYPYTRYEGGSTVDYPAPLEVLPLFVRAGAFIPMADYKMSNTGDYRADRFTVNYYPVEGVTSSFTMYDDDRISPSALADGNYRLVTFDGACAHSGLTTIDINAAGTYPGAPSKIRLDFAVKGVTSAPAAVSVNGRTVKSRHDAATATLTFSFDFVPSQNTHIAIQR